jgi:polyphosphate kinase
MVLAAEVVRTEERYIDREFSWLAFNERVLELAEDAEVPLLERARFLAIFSGNLDEFFMVRVAGLKRRIAAGVAVRAASGLLPREVHQGTLSLTRELMSRQASCFHDDVLPALEKEASRSPVGTISTPSTPGCGSRSANGSSRC